MAGIRRIDSWVTGKEYVPSVFDRLVSFLTGDDFWSTKYSFFPLDTHRAYSDPTFIPTRRSVAVENIRWSVRALRYGPRKAFNRIKLRLRSFWTKRALLTTRTLTVTTPYLHDIGNMGSFDGYVEYKGRFGRKRSVFMEIVRVPTPNIVLEYYALPIRCEGELETAYLRNDASFAEGFVLFVNCDVDRLTVEHVVKSWYQDIVGTRCRHWTFLEDTEPAINVEVEWDDLGKLLDEEFNYKPDDPKGTS